MSSEPPVFVRVKEMLTRHGVAFTTMHHEPVYTSPQAAAVRGAPLHSGAKALILKVKGKFLMAVLPADRSLDNNAFRKLIGSKTTRFATKDEVFELTSLTPGSIPPFGSMFGLQTHCDPALSDNEKINFSAGSHTDSVRMSYEDYIRIEQPIMGRLSKPAS